MTLEQFKQRFESWTTVARERAGFSEADFRQLIEGSIYREKLVEALEAEVATTAEQVRARHILVETREEAEEVLARLDEGESFADLAAEVSTDTSNKDDGGDLGWFARGTMVEAFDQVAFDMEPGQLSDVVETDFGFHVIKVEEHETERELEPDALARAQDKAVEEWYQVRRTAPSVLRQLDPTMYPTAIPTPRLGR
jgi:foldase protein PrsA